MASIHNKNFDRLPTDSTFAYNGTTVGPFSSGAAEIMVLIICLRLNRKSASDGKFKSKPAPE